jgi:uncharacterized protein (TIGR02391 family)
MHDLTVDQREILTAIWDLVDHRWWGPETNDFHATHMDKYAVTESLFVPNLITQAADPQGVVRFRFMTDGFFYLDDARRTDAAKDTATVIATMKRLYPVEKVNRIPVARFAEECKLTPEVACKTLTLLANFGISAGINVDSGLDAEASFIMMNAQIAKATTFDAAYESKRKEHLRSIEFRGRMVKGEFVWSEMKPLAASPVARREPVDMTAPALFEKLVLHPEIKKVSERLFADGHYPQAIFEAFKFVNNLVKEKSGKKELDGQSLMSHAFSEKNPVLRLNPLASTSDRDEQQGFMWIFMGSMTGIRNPKAHEIVEQKDPVHALQYLALADLLARRVDESKK